MSKRKNNKDFEMIYLKANPTRKAFGKRYKKQVNEMLSDRNFSRCAAYIANNTFKKNRNLLLNAGYEYEDIHSMVVTFGLGFVRYASKFKPGKDRSYVLMRYMNQRSEEFTKRLRIKFHVNESHSEAHLEDISPQAYSHLFFQESPDQMNHEEDAFSCLEDISGKIEHYKQLLIGGETEAKSKLSSLKKKHKEIKAKIKSEKRKKKSAHKQQWSEFKKNIHNHASELCRVATSKEVDHQARRKARNLCKQNGINYIEWAKKQISEKGLATNDFVF